MKSAELLKIEDGRFSVTGDLNFKTVSDLFMNSTEMFTDGSTVEIDLARVGRVDSAGLALLIEWMKIAHLKNIRIRFRNLSEQMYAIARTSELDGILSID